MSGTTATAQSRSEAKTSAACSECGGKRLDDSVALMTDPPMLDLCTRCKGVGTIRPCHCTSMTTCGRCRAAGEDEGGLVRRRTQLNARRKPVLDPSLQRMLDLVTDVNNHLVGRNSEMHSAIEEAYQILMSKSTPDVRLHNAAERLRGIALTGSDLLERRGARRMAER